MSHYGLNGRFLLDKIPIEFSEIPRAQWNGTVTPAAQTLPKPVRAFSYCSCKKYTKVRYWGDLRRTIWSTGKGPTKMRTGQSGPCSFKFRSDQTEMVHSNGCTNRNFRNFGLNGKRPLNYWKCVSNFPSPDWHYWRWLFELFNHGAFSILVNTLPPRTRFLHCFADGLNQKFISVCGASCRVVRCQVLRIKWNFKFLERKKVFVISKSVVFKEWSQEETDKARS